MVELVQQINGLNNFCAKVTLILEYNRVKIGALPSGNGQSSKESLMGEGEITEGA